MARHLSVIQAANTIILRKTSLKDDMMRTYSYLGNYEHVLRAYAQ